MKAKPTFEHETCSRCCGGGEYSFNLMHGSRCYGCAGTGYKLTKRGQAAQQFLNEMRALPMENFQIGDLIRFDGASSRWEKIVSIEFLNGEQAGYVNRPDLQCVRIKTNGSGMIGFVGSKYTKGFTAEEKQKQVDKALAYQETLTKTGKTRKQKIAA